MSISSTGSSITFGNYMFKVDNINSRTRCEICSKLTIKTAKSNGDKNKNLSLDEYLNNLNKIKPNLASFWCLSSHLVLLFLLLALSR